MEHSHNHHKQENNNQNFLSISILIAAVLISGAILYTKNSNNLPKQNKEAQIAQNQNNQPNQLNQANKEDILKIKSGDVILGDPNAKVTIIEYGDYECGFCERFYKQTEPLIRKNYIETGKAKMIYRDFPLPGHAAAIPAALAANCAKDQGKFWLYHDELFNNYANLNNLDYVKLAENLKLNKEEFKTCFENKKYLGEIQKNYEEGKLIGVNGTPSFFINGKQIIGAQPYEAFEKIIEQELQSQ
jgi:protein-disulfide isomerase